MRRGRPSTESIPRTRYHAAFDTIVAVVVLVRKLLLNLVLAVPVLLFLLALEIGFRVHAYYSDARLQQGLEGVGAPARADELSLQHIIRWHPDPRIIYELVPGLTGDFRGHRLTINADGFRGPVVPRERAPGSFRIVGLGDSVMFGWGVGDGEFYLAELGRLLAKARPDLTIEWINSAVPGYNTVNEIETFEQKLLAYRPDLVVLDYVNNDLHVPGFIRAPQPYFALDRSFLARFVRNRLDGLHVPDNTLERPPDAFRRESFEGAADEIPEAYRDVIGIDAFRAALGRLAVLATEHGFRVLVFAHFGVDGEPRAVLESLGFEIVDGYPVARDYLASHGVESYQGSALTVGRGDAHPSALYHRLLAERLAAHVEPYLDAVDGEP